MKLINITNIKNKKYRGPHIVHRPMPSDNCTHIYGPNLTKLFCNESDKNKKNMG